jgi:hypothetical protein
MHLKAFYETRSVKIAKQNAGSSARMRSIKDWTLWRGRPSSETVEELIACFG